MIITPIAWTQMDWNAIRRIIPGTVFVNEAVSEFDRTDMEHLIEFSGRACYKAFDRKNAATATTHSYIGHIIDQGHFSVLEHATITFHVSGVSRALLLELERHRFLSFSVESQRYVDQAKSHPASEGPVIPPALKGTVWEENLRNRYSEALVYYTEAVNDMVHSRDMDRKTARGAARAFLPESTPVDLVVTGNLRCWRDVIAKRYHEAADAEIREFAATILSHIGQLAPAAVQDIKGPGSY